METIKRVMLACSGLVCAVVTPLAASAGENVTFAAIKINKADKFELVLDDKNAGRMVFFSSFRAVNKQTKGGDLIDGMNNTGGGYADITQGRGHISGFDVNEKEGDTWKGG
jgi:hypothetical protein